MLRVRSARFPLVMALAALLVAALALAGCQSGSQVLQAGTGYVSGDGSVTTWPQGTRPGPVELTGPGIDGAPIVIQAGAGDVIVLNFWQSACPPCRAEAADLVGLSNEFEADGVRFYGINGTDDAATAEAFDRTYSVTYPTILDKDSSATAALQGVVAVRAVPTTVILDSDGRVAARVLGRIDPATARTLIKETVAEGR